MIKSYREKSEIELAKMCEDIRDDYLAPSAASSKSKDFYHKT